MGVYGEERCYVERGGEKLSRASQDRSKGTLVAERFGVNERQKDRVCRMRVVDKIRSDDVRLGDTGAVWVVF